MRVIRLLALMLLTLLQACAPSPPSAEPPHAYWAEAGVLYVASGAPGNVRVMYARGGGITCQRSDPGHKVACECSLGTQDASRRVDQDQAPGFHRQSAPTRAPAPDKIEGRDRKVVREGKYTLG